MASNHLGHEVLHLPREDTDALPEGRSDRLSCRHDMQLEPSPSERALRGGRYAGYIQEGTGCLRSGTKFNSRKIPTRLPPDFHRKLKGGSLHQTLRKQ